VLEVLALTAVKSDSDGSGGGLAVLLEVVKSVLDTVVALSARGTASDPGEDFVSEIDDEHVLVVELVASGGSTVGDLGHLESTRGVAKAEDGTASGLTLKGKIVTTFSRAGIRTLAKTINPLLGPAIRASELIKDDNLRNAATLVIEGTADYGGLALLESSRLLTIELDDKKTKIKDEHITAVDRLGVKRNLDKTDVPAALNLKKARFVFLGLDLVEASLNTTVHDADAVGEVALEERRLEALDLTVLDWCTTKVLVELDGLVGGSAHLILSALVADPEVDIPLKLLASLADVSVENDVRIAGEESTKAALGLRDNMELLDTPDLKTNLATSLTPLLGNVLLAELELLNKFFRDLLHYN